jgi:hypothetical protein
MRPGQQNKRGRGRGSNNNGGGGGGGNNNFNRKGGNPLSRTYDSSGPDIKIRGTAQHIAEKYSQLGRDAQSSGDRVIAENYLQHAEHYNRIIAAAQAQMQDRFQQQDRGEFQDRDGNSVDQDDMDGDGEDLGYAPQPVIEDQQRRDQNQNREQNQSRENQPNRDNNQQGQDQPPRENRRDRNERRERRPERNNRPVAAEQPDIDGNVAADAEVAQPAPVVAQAAPLAAEERRPRPAKTVAAPVADGSGPQPVIEGIPAEVAVEEEAQGEATPRRRRTASTRPRRQPRKTEGEGDAGTEGGEPALAEAGE